MSRQSLTVLLLGVALTGLAGSLAGCAGDPSANPQLSSAAVSEIDVPPDLVQDDDGRAPGLEPVAQ
jgi:hypothetical protein